MSDEPATPAPSKGPSAVKWLTWGFAAFGILAGAAVIFLAVLAGGFMLPREPRQPVEVAGSGDTPAERYNIEGVEPVRGTGLLEITIGVGGGGISSGSYSGPKRAFEQRNLILLDKATGTSRKLLSDNSREIARNWYLPAQAEQAPARETEEFEIDGTAKKEKLPPFAYYVLAVRHKQGESQDVLVGDLASGKQGFVLSGIDGVDRIWMLNATQVALLLREKRTLHYRVIDIPTLKVILARPVDIG